LLEQGLNFLQNRQGQNLVVRQNQHAIAQSTRDYHLTIDNTPPTVKLSKVGSAASGQIHVEGEAKDNNRVASITIDGQPLAFTPGPDVPFSVDVPAQKGGAVVVEDSAGNKTSQPLQ